MKKQRAITCTPPVRRYISINIRSETGGDAGDRSFLKRNVRNVSRGRGRQLQRMIRTRHGGGQGQRWVIYQQAPAWRSPLSTHRRAEQFKPIRLKPINSPIHQAMDVRYVYIHIYNMCVHTKWKCAIRKCGGRAPHDKWNVTRDQVHAFIRARDSVSGHRDQTNFFFFFLIYNSTIYVSAYVCVCSHPKVFRHLLLTIKYCVGSPLYRGKISVDFNI